MLRVNLTEGSQQRPCDLDICSTSHKGQGMDKTDGFLIEHDTSGSISSRIFMSTQNVMSLASLPTHKSELSSSESSLQLPI